MSKSLLLILECLLNIFKNQGIQAWLISELSTSLLSVDSSQGTSYAFLYFMEVINTFNM